MQSTPEELESAQVNRLLLCPADLSRPLPTAGRMHAFLSAWYLHDRFEGRNGPVWGADYSGLITRSSLEGLERCAITCISRHESRTGCAVWFDRDLRVVNPIAANGGRPTSMTEAAR